METEYNSLKADIEKEINRYNIPLIERLLIKLMLLIMKP